MAAKAGQGASVAPARVRYRLLPDIESTSLPISRPLPVSRPASW